MTADTYRRRGAEHAPLFAALNCQWEVTAGSRQLRPRLGEWSLKHPVLVDYPDGIALMADLRRCARWRRVCGVSCLALHSVGSSSQTALGA